MVALTNRKLFPHLGPSWETQTVTHRPALTGLFWHKKEISKFSFAVFRHEDRDKALHLCGWHFERDSAMLTKCLERLQKEHMYSRAAAIAVFNLKIKVALDILNQAAERNVDSVHLSIVAMALAGFSDDKSSMWRQLCSNTRSQLTDPYLRAMFAFLTAESYNYENVLVISFNSLDVFHSFEFLERKWNVCR